MTPDQILILVLLLGLLCVFAMDRFRPETVAIAGLAAAVLLGLVPTTEIFTGLTSPAVITVVEVLLIVQALGRSRIFDRLGEWIHKRVQAPGAAVLTLCALAACLSSVMNNVAAFSLMLPAAFAMMSRHRVPARWIFLPLSYATLLGGLWTSIGTPPNLIAGAMLREATGKTYAFLDFAPAGIAATLAGLAALAVWLPRTLYTTTQSDTAEGLAPDPQRVMTALMHADPLPRNVADIEERLGGRIRNIVSKGRRIFPLLPHTTIDRGDHLLVEADPGKLSDVLRSGMATYAGDPGRATATRIRAVVMPHSVLAGSCIATLDPEDAPGVTILHVEGEPARFEGPFEELPFRVGNLLLLQGEQQAIRAFIGYYDLIEVAGEADVQPAAAHRWPLAVFALGILASAVGAIPTEVALAGVVAIFCVSGQLDLRTGLRNLNWSIIILLIAMLPLGSALGTTGAAAALANGLTDAIPLASGMAAVFALMGLAMAITPFVNNTTTLAILAPVALEVARSTGHSPQMLLMAVTMGASLDFLTPFGHHNNTLAFSLGSYRFGDFLRVGWPVALASAIAAGLALLAYW